MIKCFLSHSSQDKDRYVRLVAKKIKAETKIFDEETFEAGMSPSEEIINGLDDTSLFVIFISESALKSKWVKDELKQAKEKVDAGFIDRIYPIIIDESITFQDKRIPSWMKKGLNIQHIRQPNIAARKINSRLREIAWKNHPTLKERENIFVGRNDKIKNVEQRFDDFSKQSPIVFIASGLNSIGRKSFIKYSLKKASVIRDSYIFPQIPLDQNDSIEDFILKLDDIGFNEATSKQDLLQTSMDDKIIRAIELVTIIINEKERVIIEDKGAIIQYDGIVVDWFQKIIDAVKDREHLVFCISSKYRTKIKTSQENEIYYTEELAELEKYERDGLLLRYSKFKELDIERKDLEFFSSLLTGYPEQVIYAIDLIAESSVFEAKKNSHLIQEYATDKAKLIIENIKDAEQLNFLYFLTRFEFISFDFLFDIVEEKTYFPILSSFLLSSVCERLGATGDYIRVNDIIKDFISRNKFEMPKEFSDQLTKHVNEFLENYSDDNKDISDYIFSIQEALLQGKEIPEELLIPSYFLKTIKALYEKRGNANYKEVIRLADRVLLKEEYLHENIIEHIYFLKCQALARLRDNDFFSVVKKLREPENSFLHGFFYRISGNQEKSIKSYMRVLEQKPNDFRTKSELVLVYMQNDEHELAFNLAKEVYERTPNNAININNYLTCLFHKDKTEVDISLINEILGKLKAIPSVRAKEMYYSARAKYLAKYDNDIDGAFAEIEESINRYPDTKYPLLTLANLSIQYKKIDKLKFAISELEKSESRNSQTYRTYIRYKAIYLSMIGRYPEGIALARNELRGVRKEAMEAFYEKLKSSNS